jgi:hypothetical protein
MQDENDPAIVVSALSRRVTVEGVSVEVQIYRREPDTDWILEVIDHEGASTVFDDRFESDRAALEAAMRVIQDEGIRTFVDDRSGTLH